MDAAARIAELEQELAKERELRQAQQERVEQLEALVVELQEQLGRNSSNSNQPPSSDSPSQRRANRAKRKRRSKKKKRKRGGQPGHKGSSRVLIDERDVDAFKDHYPGACDSCWRTLPETSVGAFSRFQVTELTRKGGVIVTEHRRHSVQCACGFITKASNDLLPRSAFGPRLCATIVMLTGVFHLSRRQAQQLLADIFGISIALGSISNIEHRISERLRAGYQRAKDQADDAAVKHADGTGWRRAGVSLSLWTVATTTVTVFTILANGSAERLRSLFGRIKGILISDRAKAINFWKMARRQICWAHLRRKFISFSERDGPARSIGQRLVEYSDVVFETYRAFAAGTISRRVFRKRMAPVRRDVEALLQQAADKKLRRLSGSCADIVAHKQALWNFVDRPGVEPTNNHAEREIRSFVLWRKKSFGSQSERGDRFAERIMTAVHSLRKQRRAVMPHLTAVLSTGEPAGRPLLLAA